MVNWRDEEILVLAKAYPTPSTKYGETVCTAGVTRSGEWIRLYPITFRDLPFNKRYEKFQWIKAKIAVRQYDRASASLLQRRLSIGYSRAARILDQLEAAGVVGHTEGAKPRDVLKNTEEKTKKEKNG